MLASVIIDRVAEILQDTGNLTWTETQLIAWFNDAQRAVVAKQPWANSTTQNIVMVDGTRQSLPATAIRLLKVHRNKGTDGGTPGLVVRGPLSADTLDENTPDWHSATPVTEVKGWVYNPKDDPKEFWVTPPAIAGRQIEVTISENPSTISQMNDSLGVDDVYAPAMIDWMLYRAFSRDAPETPNGARARSHRESFELSMGGKVQGDVLAAGA